ncbi:MAG: L,D-transpeptidase family protein [Caldilineaceae bacterium]
MRRVLLVLLAASFAIWLNLSTVQANDHLEVTRSDNPPVPRLGANMDVPLTYGWETPAELPTVSEKWIDVDLSDQRAVAYEGTRPVRAFTISSGLPGTPTVKGTFRIWVRTRADDVGR